AGRPRRRRSAGRPTAARSPRRSAPRASPATAGSAPRVVGSLGACFWGRPRRRYGTGGLCMQLWTTQVASARGAQRTAQEVEAAGWDGLLVVDSQNLSGDPYVALALAAVATKRIGLGTGVTNSVTRHAAATATAITSVNRISHGRAVLGIGRGDSALAHLGRAPARLKQFERYLAQLQAFLSGESVPFEEIDIPFDAAPPMSELHLHDAPPASRISWIADGLETGNAKVPMEVAASGPKVIAFGAYINMGCHSDVDKARGLVRGGLTTFARFSVMHGKANGPVSAKDRAQLETLVSNYDMKQHTRADSRQAGTLADDFVDR